VLGVLVQLARCGDSDAVRLVDLYDWYIMPVVNPDGYSFTFTNVSIHTPRFTYLFTYLLQ